MLHIFTRKEPISKPDSLRLEAQALTDFLRSNNVEDLIIAGPRESKERGVYAWTLTILRSLNRAASVGIHYIARNERLLITGMLGTLVIADPKVLEFYDNFCNHRASSDC